MDGKQTVLTQTSVSEGNSWPNNSLSPSTSCHIKGNSVEGAQGFAGGEELSEQTLGPLSWDPPGPPRVNAGTWPAT